MARQLLYLELFLDPDSVLCFSKPDNHRDKSPFHEKIKLRDLLKFTSPVGHFITAFFITLFRLRCLSLLLWQSSQGR